MKKNQEVFTEIYVKNLWGSPESASGPGSEVKSNTKLLSLLNEFVTSHNIKSILDCGCGDFNWMRLFDFNNIDSYTGVDIVQPLIESNKSKHSSDKVSFQCLSIMEDKLPEADLVICKDVLFHLSLIEAQTVLENIKKTGVKYLISTTFTDFKNYDIHAGGWRPINLLDSPFNLGTPYLYWENIEERNDSYSNKSISVWKF